MDNSIIALIAAVVPPLAFGLSDTLWKKPVLAIGPHRVIMIRNILTTSLLIILSFFIQNEIPASAISTESFLKSIAVCFVSYFGLYFFNKAHQHGPIAVLVPVSNSGGIISFLIAVLVLGESLKNGRLLGSILIFAGTLLMIYIDIKGNTKKENFTCISYALLAALFWGISYSFFGLCTHWIGTVYFSILLEGVILLITLVRLFLIETKEKKYSSEIKFQHYLLIGLIALLGMMGVYTANLGFYQFNVTGMFIIGGISLLLPQLASFFIYKEKFNRIKYVPILLIIIGVLTSYHLKI